MNGTIPELSKKSGAPALLAGGLVLTVAVLPLNLIAVQTGLGLMLLALLAARMQNRLDLGPPPLSVPLLAWIGAAVLSMIAAPEPIRSVFSSTSLWVLAAYFVFNRAVAAPGGTAAAEKALLAAIAISAAVSVFAIWQHFHGTAFGILGQRLDRAPGTADSWVAIAQFHRHTTLAFVLSLAAAAGAAFAFERPERRVLVLALLAPVLVALFFTYVRMAWFALAAALIVMGILKSWRLGMTGLLALGVAAGAAAAASPSVAEKIGESFSRSGDSGRAYIWRRAMDMTHDNPVTGIGYGNFSYVAKRYYDRVWPNFNVRCHAHNLYLHYWCETGPLGLFAVVWFFVAFFFLTVGAWRRGPPGGSRFLILSSIAAGTIVTVASTAQDVIFDGHVMFFFLFLAGAGAAAANAKEDAPARSGQPPAGC